MGNATDPSLPGPPHSHQDPVASKPSTLTFPTTRLTLLSSRLIRFEWSPDGQFEDRKSTFAINRRFPVPTFDVEHIDGGVIIVTEHLNITYDGKNFTPEGLEIVTRSAAPFKNKPETWRWGQAPKGNLGGTVRTLDNVDGRTDQGLGILSTAVFSLIDDSSTMLFTDAGWVDSRVTGRTDHYFFAYARDYTTALQDFFHLSGPIPPVPRWALGNWWTRYYAYTDTEYLGLMDRFKSEGMPLSVAVLDMDWHLVTEVPRNCGGGWTGYTWNKKLFADPKGFMKQLHARNLVISACEHPAEGFRSYEEVYKRACEFLDRDPALEKPIKFDCADKKFMSAYFDIHHLLEDQGIDCWWIDWQAGSASKKANIDPLWVLNHYHFWDSARKGRPMTFSRYSGLGGHRYPIGFSGDTISTWDSLAFQPEFTATAANVGYGWWSHDIGGHVAGDHELFARWAQWGLWSPIFRLHSSFGDFDTREPWRYNEETCKSVGQSMRYRHRLVPYLYTMSIRAARDGRCLVEPMYHSYPLNDGAYANRNQYLFGSELLVAPLTSRREYTSMMAATEVWLPKGQWVDIFTNTVYDGQRSIKMSRTLEHIPVLARPGAVLPLDLAETSNGTRIPVALELVIVVGADGRFVVIEDEDRDTVQSETPIAFDQAAGLVSIGPTTHSVVDQREWQVRLPAFKQPTEFCPTATGSVIQKVWTDNGQTVISVARVSAASQIQLRLGKDPQLRDNDIPTAVYAIIDRAQMDPKVKQMVWEVFKGDKERHVVMGQLVALDLSLDLMDAVLEHLLA